MEIIIATNNQGKVREFKAKLLVSFAFVQKEERNGHTCLDVFCSAVSELSSARYPKNSEIYPDIFIPPFLR